MKKRALDSMKRKEKISGLKRIWGSVFSKGGRSALKKTVEGSCFALLETTVTLSYILPDPAVHLDSTRWNDSTISYKTS
jgi:hypothetical protein